MERHPVRSSLIRSIGYDLGSSILEVELLGGSTYDYFDVPYSVFVEFLEADSKGEFFNESIRDVYPFEVVERIVP